ncbi:MAG: FAD-dependent oxidoreductase [Streptosporangiaceae bacterium]
MTSDPSRTTEVAIIGAGISGLTAAIALGRAGQHVTIYEQAPRFGQVGAAINIAPNAVRALDGMGLESVLRARSYRPSCRISRDWRSGKELTRVQLADGGHPQFGAPMLFLHRADLLDILERALPPSISVRFGHRLIRFQEHADRVTLAFDGGGVEQSGLLIGADGIHSAVRRWLGGPDEPVYTGAVAYRTFARLAALSDLDLTPFVKWWSPDSRSELVTFPISPERLFIFGTTPQPIEPPQESWSSRATHGELAAAFSAYHPDARLIVAAATDEILKTALYVRKPLQRWVGARVALVGDACHPMTPYMAQGAAMGLEDAVILARCLSATASGCNPARALRRYQDTRLPRATQIQVASNENTFLRSNSLGAEQVYTYDAWHAPLAPNPSDTGTAPRITARTAPGNPG